MSVAMARAYFLQFSSTNQLEGNPMKNDDAVLSSRQSAPALDRRQLLGFASATGLAVAAVGQPRFAAAEILEQGDEQCQVAQPAVQSVDLSDDMLADFVAVSQALTGEKVLPRRLAAEYLDRFAKLWDSSKTDIPNPGYFPKLKALNDKYKGLPNPSPDDRAAQLVSDAVVGDAAQQVIYLWYVSAFFIEPPDNSIGAKPGTFKAGKTWIYGTQDQYRQGLLWRVLRTHAPAMPQPGGGYGYWAYPAKSMV